MRSLRIVSHMTSWGRGKVAQLTAQGLTNICMLQSRAYSSLNNIPRAMHRRRSTTRWARRVTVSVAACVLGFFAVLGFWERSHPRRPEVLAVIGVMTAFDSPTRSYAERRHLLRQTWFPKDSLAQRKLEKYNRLAVSLTGSITLVTMLGFNIPLAVGTICSW